MPNIKCQTSLQLLSQFVTAMVVTGRQSHASRALIIAFLVSSTSLVNGKVVGHNDEFGGDWLLSLLESAVSLDADFGEDWVPFIRGTMSDGSQDWFRFKDDASWRYYDASAGQKHAGATMGHMGEELWETVLDLILGDY